MSQLRELALTQILHRNFKRKMQQTIRNLFGGMDRWSPMISVRRAIVSFTLNLAPRTGRA
jgi:hypothetical protein